MTEPSQEIELKDKQAKAIDILLLGGTQSEAANAVGVSRRTISRWLGQPAFKQAAREIREAIYQQTKNELAEFALDSLETLKQMRDQNPDNFSPTRLAAAKLFLDYSHKWAEREADRAIQEQLDTLQEQINQLTKQEKYER